MEGSLAELSYSPYELAISAKGVFAKLVNSLYSLAKDTEALVVLPDTLLNCDG